MKIMKSEIGIKTKLIIVEIQNNYFPDEKMEFVGMEAAV
jgi:hypothetical protein